MSVDSRRKVAKASGKIKRQSKSLAASRDSRSSPKVVEKRVRYAAVVPSPAPMFTAGDIAGLHLTRDPLALQSNVALVMDQNTSEVLFEKNSNVALPIASLTKLMTALVVVEARQDLEEMLEVTHDDIDREKNSGSRLRIGAQLTRANMLHIALMSSENRAASALGRHYPGGLPAFVSAMNAKAKALGMHTSRFVDSTGLSSGNVASANDLAKLVFAAYQHSIIRTYSTDPKYAVDTGAHLVHYVNSNRLVMDDDWDIGLQKTGYISEAGRCLVMQARIENRPVVMIFLDSKGKYSRIADAARIRKWLESGIRQPLMTQVNAKQS
ncbi:D-alanyl-D-alanine endopeptidase [Noviherbaspirillum sp.]|uniref:D-alanyl-D-alanine endopeptidase n=1 Tax=Noviherbaspirillum sp. TaxID=1926288 RepID=UPI003FA54B0A